MMEAAPRVPIERVGGEKGQGMAQTQTALGRLLQERREAAGYSRTRIAELVGIKPGTIEGWELGRVGKPPVHDVLRLAHVLRIPTDDVQRAVFEDSGDLPGLPELPGGKGKRARPRPQPAVPLLEVASRLFGWTDDAEVAEALGTTSERVRRWRSGAEQMALADYLTLTSMIAVAAAEAARGGDARSADARRAANEVRLQAPAASG